MRTILLALLLTACESEAVIVKDTGYGAGPDESPTGPDIAVSPTTLAFGAIDVGDTSAQSFVVTNEGDLELDVDLALSGSDAYKLSVTTLAVNSGAAQAVVVTFQPPALGDADGVVVLSSNDVDEPSVAVILSGAGAGDTAAPTDTGPTDTGTGPSDTGPTDTGPTDTDPTDTGTGPTDTGPTDTGPTDTDPTDTGPTDTAATTDTGTPSDTGTDTGPVDLDGDGYSAADDCDDADAAVNPGATELCNGIDDDCDGTTDIGAADETDWYLDADGDGYGDATFSTSRCDAPAGYVADGTDCDDADAAVNPGATEVCDAVDNDCDGILDNATWYEDADGDGFGDPGVVSTDCTAPSGYVADATDCDDEDGAVYPGADEVCGGIDDDCDGEIDEDAIDAGTWYADADGDGYGDADVSSVSCDAPAGYVADASDCDDADAAVSPAATELCNGIDDDCDGEVDEDDAADGTSWYADADGDGFGDATAGVTACDAPPGYVADATDCLDTDSSVNPAGTEVCNGLDDDCDGVTDPDTSPDASTWYVDADGDGYGDGTASTTACDAPAGYVADATDCDDGVAAVNPGATEVCDGLDNDCDGVIDPDTSADASTWYADADGDGYGDAGTATTACDPPSGHVSDATDCDDTDSAVNPGATEISYNQVDDDCNGRQDDMVAADESGWTVLGTTSSNAIGNGGVWTLDDLNADGDDELVIAATADDKRATNAGSVAFHDDGTRGAAVDFDDGWLIVGGKSSGDAAGSALTLLGDADGDGHDELSVGAYLSNEEADDGGCVYTFDVYSGASAYTGSQSIDSIREGRICGEEDDAWVGYALASGDIDGDGEVDLVIGAPGDNDERGRVYGFLGSGGFASEREWTTDDRDTRPKGHSREDHLGRAVLADDFDGDGVDEVVLCAPDYSSSAGGCFYLTGEDYLDADGDDVTTWDSAAFTGAAASDELGYGPLAVASGDLDGDGTPDLALGAPGYDGAETDGGGVGIWVGEAFAGSIAFSAADMLVQGDGALGRALSVGDVDGDGTDDLMAGAPTATTSAGVLYLVAGGSLSGTLTFPGDEAASWAGSTSGDALGMAVGGAASGGLRDLDGDGTDDLAVAATGEDSGAGGAGIVYVLPGY